mmetsp:Transcript_21329/g.44825  ORF Transcript_21329/g.44825 Transcript_21329/m.44825 type:complete len:679 (-) Transcript_21329:159-2195(-)|eukprot:CAMPEP_0171353116 /NCGR_PEP_ID=MMETSP0878-20121228/43311_1 /TAXON_ID=67004 /ORGANISM="Thalassiosira weissflogii, Strain CCMP1336" /LENGTH=678 /DNA_ID=CAMNT_0011858961 /DNA_START=196 /DNA_END=2232 /DNA_ORIENTATION=-
MATSSMQHFPQLSTSFVDDTNVSCGFLSRVAKEDEERNIKRLELGESHNPGEGGELSSCNCIYCRYPSDHAHCINCSCDECCNGSASSYLGGCDENTLPSDESQFYQDGDCSIFGLPELEHLQPSKLQSRQRVEDSISNSNGFEQVDNSSSSSDSFFDSDASWDPGTCYEGITRPGNPSPSFSTDSSTRSPELVLYSQALANVKNEHPYRESPSTKVSFSDDTNYLSSKYAVVTPVKVSPAKFDKNAFGTREPVNLSLADYELSKLLEQDIASLQAKRDNSLTAIDGIERTTASHRLELLRILAVTRGAAKSRSLLDEVEMLGKLRTEKKSHETQLQDVERLLRRRNDKLLELMPNSNRGDQFIPSLSLEKSQETLEGQWFSLTKATYADCLGDNDDSNPMYRLGRMTFELFMPGDLVCAIQAVFNPITEAVENATSSRHLSSKYHYGYDDDFEFDEVSRGTGKHRRHQFTVPKALQDEVRRALRRASDSGSGAPVLRTYNIVTAFTIEPYSPQFGHDSPNKLVMSPIRGILTTEGFALPDPNKPDRLSVWFSGGKIECGEPKDSHEFEVWKYIFGSCNAGASPSSGRRPSPSERLLSKRRTFREGAFVLAAKLMLGASGFNDGMDENTGEMKYSFSRPIGGHGKTYVDILHLDDNVRVMRGHAGTIYAFSRIGEGAT